MPRRLDTAAGVLLWCVYVCSRAGVYSYFFFLDYSAGASLVYHPTWTTPPFITCGTVQRLNGFFLSHFFLYLNA